MRADWLATSVGNACAATTNANATKTNAGATANTIPDNHCATSDALTADQQHCAAQHQHQCSATNKVRLRGERKMTTLIVLQLIVDVNTATTNVRSERHTASTTNAHVNGAKRADYSTEVSVEEERAYNFLYSTNMSTATSRRQSFRRSRAQRNAVLPQVLHLLHFAFTLP